MDIDDWIFNIEELTNDIKRKINKIKKQNFALSNSLLGDFIEIYEEELEELIAEAESIPEAEYDEKIVSEKLSEVREALKEFKQSIEKKYIEDAKFINDSIESLTSDTTLTEEEKRKIPEKIDLDALIPLENIQWNTKLRLNYHSISEKQRMIDEILESKGKTSEEKPEETTKPDEEEKKPTYETLQAKLQKINDEYTALEKKDIKDITEEEIDKILESIVEVTNLCNSASLEPIQKTEITEKLDEIRNNATALRERKKTEDPKTPYEYYKDELSETEKEVKNLEIKSSPLDAGEEVTDEEINELNRLIKESNANLDELEEKIKKDHDDKILDDTQFQNLDKEIKAQRNEIEEIKGKITAHHKLKADGIKKPESIEELTALIDKFKETVDKAEKPIDKDKRNELNQLQKIIYSSIVDLKKELKKSKKDEAKYNEEKRKLDEQKQRFFEISKNYRDKCPKKVKAVKSAQDFYRKHKKIILISLGLTILAATIIFVPGVGNAIMQGNIMMGNKIPFLRPFAHLENNILGPLIGAKKLANGIWLSSAGLPLTMGFESESLLLAIAYAAAKTVIKSSAVVALLKKTKLLDGKIKKAQAKIKSKFTKEKPEQPEPEETKVEYPNDIMKEFMEKLIAANPGVDIYIDKEELEKSSRGIIYIAVKPEELKLPNDAALTGSDDTKEITYKNSSGETVNVKVRDITKVKDEDKENVTKVSEKAEKPEETTEKPMSELDLQGKAVEQYVKYLKENKKNNELTIDEYINKHKIPYTVAVKLIEIYNKLNGKFEKETEEEGTKRGR